MESLIQLDSFAVQATLDILLKDKTTKQNIIWATNSYQEYGPEYGEKKQITKELLTSMESIDIQPRVLKSLEAQKDRTKAKAEVMTPSWICALMNNHCDDEWFGKENVFNILNDDHTWKAKSGKIHFPNLKGKTWEDYVKSNRLEITCGEAPYLVSRYDTTTGEFLPLAKRVGILDRKLRVVNENTTEKEEWLLWALRAFKATYGYEFQGDNLLIARINLLMTFVENYQKKWKEDPDIKLLKKVANIIAWNIWQMDGLTFNVPLDGPDVKEPFNKECRIYDWGSNHSIDFKSLRKEK